MSDLVQRLRQVGAHHWYEHDGSAFCFRCRTFAADWKQRPSTPCQPDALMTEAAEEIERQNRMLETYRAECEGWQAALEKAERQRDEAQATADRWKADYRTVNAALAEAQAAKYPGCKVLSLGDQCPCKLCGLERARDEARALLREIDDWFKQEGAFPDYIQARLDAALGGRDE